MPLPKLFRELFRRVTRTIRKESARKPAVAPGNRLKLGFESLEDRVAPVVDAFTWEMSPRIVPDAQGRFLIPNTDLYANPGTFEYVIDLSNTRIQSGSTEINPDTFAVTIRDSGGNLAAPGALESGERYRGRLPEGDFTVTIAASVGNQSPSTFSQSIKVDDILVVAIGDSYGSGEGAAETLAPLKTVVMSLDEANDGTNVVRIGKAIVTAPSSSSPEDSAKRLAEAMIASNYPEFKNLRYEVHCNVLARMAHWLG